MNYNTVWSAIFEPVPTFAFLKRLAKTHGYGKRHDLPTHVVGSDACGVVLRTGAAVSRWKPGDRVLVHPNYVALEEPRATTTRSSTPTSACGASSATSAAWASCASRAATS